MAAIAVATPVHRTGSQQPSQTLSGHRAFHGMEIAERTVTDHRRMGNGIGLDPALGVAQVPGEAIDVPKDMATGTRAVAVS